MCKQYFIVIFICAVLHENVALSVDSKTYARNGTVNNSTDAVVAGVDNNSTNNTSSTIKTEGGPVKLNPIPAVVHHSRENVQIDSPVVTEKPDKSKVNANTNATTNSTKLHSPSPGLVSTTTVLPTSLTTASITKPTTLLSDTSLHLEVHGDSKIKPRKGVNLTQEESNSTIITNSTLQLSTTPVITNATVGTTNTSTVTTNRTITSSPSTTPSTTTVKPKKPTVTIGSDDESPLVRAPPKVILGNRVVQPKNVTGPLPILVGNGGEQVISNRQLKKDFVFPIILTILAVPLLAIILSVVYKRGAEWWQHRHYRRMDFLIDGMYNN